MGNRSAAQQRNNPIIRTGSRANSESTTQRATVNDLQDFVALIGNMPQKAGFDLIAKSLETNLIRQLISNEPTQFTAFIQETIRQIAAVPEQLTLTAQEITPLNAALRALAVIIPVLHEREFHEFGRATLWSRKDDNKPACIDLMEALALLCFHPGYTLHPSCFTKTSKDMRIGPVHVNSSYLWAPWNQLTNDNRNTELEFKVNRLQVLNCMLALVSSDLFTPLPEEECELLPNPYTIFFLSSKNDFIYEFVYSLLNAGLDQTGSSVLPIGSNGVNEEYAMICLQLLCLFLEQRASVETINHLQSTSPELSTVVRYLSSVEEGNERSVIDLGLKPLKDPLTNCAADAVAEITEDEHFHSVVTRCLSILKLPMEQEGAFFSWSKRQKVSLFEETLLLLWRCMQGNAGFISYLERNHIVYNTLFQVLLTTLARTFPLSESSGVYHLCLLCFSEMSGERGFAVILNQPYINQFEMAPLSVNVFTNGDLFFQVIIDGILQALDQKRNCYHYNLLATLANVSPFIHGLNRTTAMKLLQLTALLFSPSFLLAEQANWNSLLKVLLTLENIVVYQYPHNSSLIFECYVRREVFYRIQKAELVKRGKTTPPIVQIPVEKLDRSKKMTMNQQPNEYDFEEHKEEHNVVNLPLEDEMLSKPQKKVNGQGWRPSNEWLQNIKRSLPLENILMVLDKLHQRIEEKRAFREKSENPLKSTQEEYFDEVKEIIEETSFVGMFAPKYELCVETVSDFIYIDRLLHIFIWSQILLKSGSLTNPTPQFDQSAIELVQITKAPPKQQAAGELSSLPRK